MYKAMEKNTSPEQVGAMDEIEVVLRKFGDEQSTLLDRFERLSFEVQLNRAILGRSFSSPSGGRFGAPFVGSTGLAPASAPPPLETRVKRGRRGSGYQKALKKLLKPIFGRKGNGGAGKKEVPVPVPDPRNPMSWKAFSRSVRV